MARARFESLERDVRRGVDALARALADPTIDIVVGLVRRLPRILDALVTDEHAKRIIDAKFIYSTAPRLDPSLVEGRRIALVDDYVQTGTTIGREYRRWRTNSRHVSAFAIARSRWHVDNDQYVGLNIQEPFLDLEPEDFELLTSYTNHVLTETALPLDCDDPVLEISCHHDATARLLTELSCVSPLQQLPTSPHSDVSRYSQFFGPDHMLTAPFRPIPQSTQRGTEFKIAWTIAKDSGVFFVPIVQFRVRRQPDVFSAPDHDDLYIRALVQAFDVTATTDTPSVFFEAVHMSASAQLVGRLRNTLALSGTPVEVQVAGQHFRRRYGPTTGDKVQGAYEWIVGEECLRFEAAQPIPRADAIEPIGSEWQPLSQAVRAILRAHYLGANAGHQRLDWLPAGLPFETLAAQLVNNGWPVSADLLSAVLDHQLALCWLRTGTAPSSDDNFFETHYYCTEQTPKIQNDIARSASNHSRPAGEFFTFARPRDDLDIRLTKGFIAAVGAILPKSDSLPGLITAGYLKHAIVVALDMLGPDAAARTALIVEAQPHGRVPLCATSNNYVRGSGSLEENQELLGLRFVPAPGTKAQLVRIEAAVDLLPGSEFETSVLLCLRELADLLKALKDLRRTSMGDILVYLSTCRNASVAFPALLANIHRSRDALTGLARGVLPGASALGTVAENLSGAFDKLQVISAFESVATENDLPTTLRSHALQLYLDEIDPHLTHNGWLGALTQLTAEGYYLHAIASPPQLNLFAEAGNNVAGAGARISDLYREWSALIDQLGFVADSKWTLPHDCLVYRRDRGTGSGHIGVVKIDRARHGKSDTKLDAERMFHHHWPLFRSLAGFYHGFEARDPDGDALFLGFEVSRNALRFAHAVAILLSTFEGADLFYRVVLADGDAQFCADGNIISPATFDLLPEVESFLKTLENDVRGKGVTLGSLVDEGLWPCVSRDLPRRGLSVGERKWDGKRPVPRSILFAARQSPDAVRLQPLL